MYYRFTKLLQFSGLTDKFFVMKLLRWDVHRSTGSLKKHKPSLPCYIPLSSIYMTIKTCNRNITSSANLAYREKVNIQVSVRLSFQGLSSFLDNEKSTKCTYFVSGRCFIHPLNFCYSKFNYIIKAY